MEIKNASKKQNHCLIEEQIMKDSCGYIKIGIFQICIVSASRSYKKRINNDMVINDFCTEIKTLWFPAVCSIFFIQKTQKEEVNDGVPRAKQLHRAPPPSQTVVSFLHNAFS